MLGALALLMRFTRVCLGLVGLLTASLHVAEAAACSPEPEAFKVHSSFPVGPGAKLNGAIYVVLEQTDPDGLGEGLPELTLIDVSTQHRIALQHGSSWLQDGGFVESYGPIVSLLANTTYRAELTFYDPNLDAEQPDARNTSWEFTTGEELLPDLSTSGALRVTLESGEEPVIDCSDADSCGGGCVEVGTQPATRAVIKLPTIFGGEEAFGYDGELVVTRDTPAQQHSSGLYLDREGHEYVAGLSDVSDSNLSIILPDTTEPYQPCFAISARDAAGQRVFPEPVCLTDLVHPRPTPGSHDLDDTDDTDDTNDDDDVDVARPTGGGGAGGSRESSSCSLGRTGSGGSAWLALALLAGLVARRKR